MGNAHRLLVYRCRSDAPLMLIVIPDVAYVKGEAHAAFPRLPVERRVIRVCGSQTILCLVAHQTSLARSGALRARTYVRARAKS